MKRTFKRAMMLLMLSCLLLGSALAQSITLDGSVEPSYTLTVFAPVGGMVESVPVRVGQSVKKGALLASIETNKVYASESGIISGLFGQCGDAAETIAEKYGGVLYIEGDSVYTIEASTQNAYNTAENKFVHVGEEVNLSCYSDGKHKGTGVITSIAGENYSVEVRAGEFVMGETVNIFRGKQATVNRVGRGEVKRRNPVAVSASGSIVSMHVQNGDRVERGELLFETVQGGFDGLKPVEAALYAGEDSVIAEIKIAEGGKLEKNGVAAILYPNSAMRIEAKIYEADLMSVAVGDAASIELIWNQDSEKVYEGTVTEISRVPNPSQSNNQTLESEEVNYTVYIDFTPDEDTRYGMSAIVTIGKDVEAD